VQPPAPPSSRFRFLFIQNTELITHVNINMRRDFLGPASALATAAADEDSQQVRLLQESSQEPPNEDKDFNTPLHIAASGATAMTCHMMLAAGADAYSKGSGTSQYSAMQLAAALGCSDTYRVFLNHVDFKGEERLLHRASLLSLAAKHGRLDVLDLHLGIVGADESPLATRTALLWAVWHWQLGSVTTLLKWVCFSRDVLTEALHNTIGFKAAPSSYTDGDYGKQALITARLIEAGADPNGMWEGTRPLHRAVSQATMLGVLVVLLSKGALPEAVDGQYETPMHQLAWTLRGGPRLLDAAPHMVALTLLVSHGAHVTTRADEGMGETPIHVAAACGCDVELFKAYVQLLPETRWFGKMESYTMHGESVLHCAALAGNVDNVRFLVKSGLDVNAYNDNGWSPLMCALVPSRAKSSSCAIAMASLLLSLGASGRGQSCEGWNVLHCLALHADLTSYRDAKLLMSQLLQVADLAALGDPTALRWLTPWFAKYSDNSYQPRRLHPYVGSMQRPDPSGVAPRGRDSTPRAIASISGNEGLVRLFRAAEDGDSTLWGPPTPEPPSPEPPSPCSSHTMSQCQSDEELGF
jgi:ankyrin repeat protein